MVNNMFNIKSGYYWVYEHIIVNNKIVICTDNSDSINLSKYALNQENPIGESITTLEASKILKCIVKDIKYDDAYCMNMTWKMPSYILFEKDGHQLEIKKTLQNFNWKLKTVKHNCKIKHTDKILVSEKVLYNIDTGEPIGW